MIRNNNLEKTEYNQFSHLLSEINSQEAPISDSELAIRSYNSPSSIKDEEQTNLDVNTVFFDDKSQYNTEASGDKSVMSKRLTGHFDIVEKFTVDSDTRLFDEEVIKPMNRAQAVSNDYSVKSTSDIISNANDITPATDVISLPYNGNSNVVDTRNLTPVELPARSFSELIPPQERVPNIPAITADTIIYSNTLHYSNPNRDRLNLPPEPYGRRELSDPNYFLNLKRSNNLAMTDNQYYTENVNLSGHKSVLKQPDEPILSGLTRRRSDPSADPAPANTTAVDPLGIVNIKSWVLYVAIGGLIIYLLYKYTPLFKKKPANPNPEIMPLKS